MNLGGEYAEEIAFRLGIDKDKPSKDSLDMVPSIISEINKLLDETSLNKGFYYNTDNMLSPVRLTSLSETPGIFEDDNGSIREGGIYFSPLRIFLFFHSLGLNA